MNYILFGSPRFAALILQKLIDREIAPTAIIASPDKIAGRKKELTPPEIKAVAEAHHIPIYQPEDLKTEEVKSLLKQADFAVVAAYAKIIRSEILSLPRLGTVGIHPSLLPRFRGASPIQSVILSGASETGITIYQMDEQVDHGPILGSVALRDYQPDRYDYDQLEASLAELGADLFSSLAPQLLEGKLSPLPQEEAEATLTKKFKTADAEIEESDLRKAVLGEDKDISKKVVRMILAFSREPGAWTILQKPLLLGKQTLPASQRIKLLRARLEADKCQIQVIQIEGKKPQVV